MIYLNEEDILNLVTLDEVMDYVEEAYKIQYTKNFNMPDRVHVQNNDVTALYMPCFLEDIYGTKSVTVAPENSKKNKPVVDGIMTLNDINTGETLCMMDGKTLTAIRTGAVGGVGVRHTSNKECKSVGLIGTGAQGYYQILFAAKARNLENVYLYNKTKSKAENLKNKLEEKLENINIYVVDEVCELIKNSDIIITATTSDNSVIVDDKELLRNKHFIAIGSYKPSMRELNDSLFEIVDNVFVDTEFAKIESGDLSVPLQNNLIKEENIINFSDYLFNDNYDISNNTTLYKSVGMALFDVVVAKYIYKKALDNKIGQVIQL